MTRNIAKLISFVFSIALLASLTVAQDNDVIRTVAGSQYLISAKAGGVNYIYGRVSVDRGDSTSGYLVKGDSIDVGEKVITAGGSRSEILLNPGSYARIDELSSFEFITTDLDDLQLKLNRGSAIFEVQARKGFYVTVVTPTSRFYLMKSGVYRVDVLPNGVSRIEVRKGKAQVGTLGSKKLGKGKSALVDDNSASFSKFKRSDRDTFETWSRERAKGLAKANARLKRKSVKRSVYGSSVFDNSNTYSGSGVWAWNPFLGSYCYLPFGNGRSGYGFAIRRGIGYGDLYRRNYSSIKRREQSSYTENGGSNETRPISPPNSGSKNETPIRRGKRFKEVTGFDEDGLPIKHKRRSKTSPRGSNPRSTPRTAPRRQPRSAPKRTSPRRQPRSTPRRASPPRRSSPPRRVSPPRPQPRRTTPRAPRSEPRSRPAPRTKGSTKDSNQ